LLLRSSTRKEAVTIQKWFFSSQPCYKTCILSSWTFLCVAECRTISMGQGQEVHARKLIQMSMQQVHTQAPFLLLFCLCPSPQWGEAAFPMCCLLILRTCFARTVSFWLPMNFKLHSPMESLFHFLLYMFLYLFIYSFLYLFTIWKTRLTPKDVEFHDQY
jgi:hypothetical protein